MLISAGLITGTRTATVPQAQRNPAASALKTRFFMVGFPEALGRVAPLSIASIGVAVGSNSLTGFWTVAARGDSKEGHHPRGIHMRNFLTCAALLAATPAAFAQPQSAPPTVAIAEVTARGNAGPDLASDMSDALTEQLVAGARLRVVERQQIAKVMKEQLLAQSGAMSDEVQIKVAQLVGARFIVLGTVGTKGRSYVVSLRALDYSSAQVAFSESLKVGSDEQVDAGAKQLARRMEEKLLGPSVGGSPPSASGD